jgi:hypothetical protein
MEGHHHAMTDIRIPRDSVEFVKARVTADQTLSDSVGVELSLTPIGGVHTWLAGEWEGTEDTTRIARTSSEVTFSSANYAARTYRVFLRLTDNPETPILDAGTLRITG